ncbi:hypothetical protein B0J11DRAFT_203857 [Dendryphion nanum]|uniref:Uncharacterized protein n=1 Tax=Dendryphion nanum TaxID=256645 RepID=A0A9P9I8N2_9PLEO|nr:hypothetical protein B0J11DRAFT_203857 [Dendryphion nanum]
MAPTTKKSSKPLYKTEIPFTKTQWPPVSEEHQTVILDLLCSLLEPIGRHRQTYVHPSKGKKRKRGPNRGLSSVKEPAGVPVSEDDSSAPPSPDLSAHLLVGLNSVTRHLTTLAQKTAPPTMPIDLSKGKNSESQADPRSPTPVSLLIIPHASPSSSPAHAHLPTLLYLSSLHSQNPPRLICLPSTSESKLASALHLPRVGALGLLVDAPGAGPLVEYVQQHVGAVECKWIEECMKAEWQGVKTTLHGVQ